MNLSVSTEVVWGVKKLELALALDVTGSMASNNKMTELKKAAKSLLTTMKRPPRRMATSRSRSFRLRSSSMRARQRECGLDRLDRVGGSSRQFHAGLQRRPGSTCPWTNANHGFRCTNGPANGSTITSTIPTSGTYALYLSRAPRIMSTTTAATTAGESPAPDRAAVAPVSAAAPVGQRQQQDCTITTAHLISTAGSRTPEAPGTAAWLTAIKTTIRTTLRRRPRSSPRCSRLINTPRARRQLSCRCRLTGRRSTPRSTNCRRPVTPMSPSALAGRSTP